MDSLASAIPTLYFLFGACSLRVLLGARGARFNLAEFSAAHIPLELLLSGGFLAAALAATGLESHGPCTTVSAEACYPFFAHCEVAMYLLVLFIGGIINGPQLCLLRRIMNVAFAAYVLVPHVVTCRIAILLSVLLFLYHFCCLFAPKAAWAERTALVHVLVVQTFLWLVSVPLENPLYLWPGDTTLHLQTWELAVYAGVFLPVLGLFSAMT